MEDLVPLDHAYWVQQVIKDRLEMTLFLKEKQFLGLLDTGADVSVIAARHWPKSWPCQPSAANLQNVGTTNDPLQSAQQFLWRDERDTQGFLLLVF
jgi:hypothetical protein